MYVYIYIYTRIYICIYQSSFVFRWKKVPINPPYPMLSAWHRSPDLAAPSGLVPMPG